jgi:hypothetical protein
MESPMNSKSTPPCPACATNALCRLIQLLAPGPVRGVGMMATLVVKTNGAYCTTGVFVDATSKFVPFGIVTGAAVCGAVVWAFRFAANKIAASRQMERRMVFIILKAAESFNHFIISSSVGFMASAQI